MTRRTEPSIQTISTPVTPENVRAAVMELIRDTIGTPKHITVTAVYHQLRVPAAIRNRRRDSHIIANTMRKMGLIPVDYSHARRRLYLVPESLYQNDTHQPPS